MSKTTPSIRSYIKDTQHNILQRDGTEQGTWAFASDTGNIFVSHGGGWLQYNSASSTGETVLTHNNTTTQLPYTSLGHFDATDQDTLITPSKSSVDDQEAVSRWKSTNNGIFSLDAQRISQTPIYLTDGMGTGLPGVDFKKTKLVSPAVQNEHTYTGNFTTFMVLKFHPIWLNGDKYNVGYTQTAYPGWEGTNERNPDAPNSFGIYGPCTLTNDRSSIGAGIIDYYDANHASYRRYRYPRGGLDNVDTFSTASLFTNTYDSKFGTSGMSEERLESQVHAYIRGLGLNWGDRMILSWRSQSADKNNLGGSTDFQCAGNGYNAHYGGTMGDHVLRGLSIGQGNNSESGGWMIVGEMIIFNNYITNDDMDKIGNYLSLKWSTPWVDMS